MTAYTKEDVEKAKNSICPVPWMHMALEPDGKIIPCCLTSQHASANLGNINKDKFEDIWNSDRMKKLRNDMLNGKIPNYCKTCTDREPITGDSSRIFHLNEFPHVIDRIPEIVERLIELGVVKADKKLGYNYTNFFLNYLDAPEKYNVRILPTWFKKETIIKLNNFIENYDKKYNTSIRYRFEHVLHELTKPFDLEIARKFVKDTKVIDEIRGEDMYHTIPEMSYVKEEVEKHDKNKIDFKEI